MAGIRKLRKIQLGRETTAGTEVNATTIWRGTGTIQNLTDVVMVNEDVGYLPQVARSYIPWVGAQLDLDDTPCTYEQLLHLLEMGCKTATPVTTGGGNQYTYDFPVAAENTLKHYTVEGGDNQQEEQFLYGFTKKITMKGKAKEAVMMGGTLIGRQVAKGSFTTSLSLAAVEEVLFQKGALYIDPTTGAWGATIKAASLIEFALDIDTGLEPTWRGDANLYFTEVRNFGPKLALDLVLEHNAVGVAAKDDWLAETARLLELRFTGAGLTTTGTAYTVKTLKLQLAGMFTKFEKLDERDGNDILKGKFEAAYDTTASKFAQILVVNDLAAVP